MPRIDVLIAQHNPTDLALTHQIFTQEGLGQYLYTVQDGEEALALLFGDRWELPPRLLLLDIRMPRVGGLEVLERVRADPHTRLVPVVMLSTAREEQEVSRCRQLGANSYVIKPAENQAFAATVTTISNYWLRLNRIPQH